MTTNKFGIVALIATMMLYGCGGPDENGQNDGGSCTGNTCTTSDGGGGCEPNCTPAFTATLKAVSPLPDIKGKFSVGIAKNNDPSSKELSGGFVLTQCENVSECTLVITKPDDNATATAKATYEKFLVTKRVFVFFYPTNGLYTTKDITFTASGETKEARWGFSGGGGLNPEGRTYRSASATYQNVRAEIDPETGKVLLAGLPCGPWLNVTNFERACPDGSSTNGFVSSDRTMIHVERRAADGSLFYAEDAPQTQ